MNMYNIYIVTSPKPWDSNLGDLTYICLILTYFFLWIVDVYIFAKTVALLNCMLIQDKSIVFIVSIKFSDQPDLAILNDMVHGIIYVK